MSSLLYSPSNIGPSEIHLPRLSIVHTSHLRTKALVIKTTLRDSLSNASRKNITLFTCSKQICQREDEPNMYHLT